MKWISDSKSIRQMEKKHNERKAELKELVDSLFVKEPDNSVEHLASNGALRSSCGSSALAGNLFGMNQQLLSGLSDGPNPFASQQAALSGYGQQSVLQSQLAMSQAPQQQPMQSGLGNLTGLGASLLGGAL